MKREPRQMNLFDELIIDNFAGGGGASTGIELAIGRSVDIAINHDPEAIIMHEANHPFTKHYCENIWEVDPVEACAGRPVGLAWFSPDCKHFSKAKGGKPREQKIRGLAWVALRWAKAVKPRVIFLENVEEFITWGPLGPDGTPCARRKGSTFTAFVRALEKEGYAVEWKMLRACDYGAPTTRKRLFMVARCDGQQIVWPTPTHGDPKSKEVWSCKLKPWRTAAECIDWSLPCPSIFEREKPLAEATLRRIARGIVKYVIQAKEPYIVTCNHSGDNFRGQGVNEPMKTITASRDAHGVVVPTLIQTSYGERKGQDPRVPGLEKPLGTVMAQGSKHAVVAASLLQMGFGEAPGSPPRCIDPQKPLGTVLAGSVKHALACATLIKNYSGHYQGSGTSLDEPMHTITSQDHHSIAAVNLVRQFGNSEGADAKAPVGTTTAGGGGKTSLVVSNLVKLRGKNRKDSFTSPADPMPTITAGGTHIGEVRAFLLKYFGKSEGQGLNVPAHTLTSKDRLGLVTINQIDYQIVDIGMRMLQPHELFKAQGFPDGYLITPETIGKPFSKTAQVRMCGNSVSPVVAEALVRANYAPLKVAKRRSS